MKFDFDSADGPVAHRVSFIVEGVDMFFHIRAGSDPDDVLEFYVLFFLEDFEQMLIQGRVFEVFSLSDFDCPVDGVGFTSQEGRQGSIVHGLPLTESGAPLLIKILRTSWGIAGTAQFSPLKYPFSR